MKSQSFEFLRTKRAALADLAGLAERYAHPDPGGSLTKQRLFVEHVVAMIYDAYALRPVPNHLNARMTSAPFEASVPQVVRDKLQLIKQAGNDAAHLDARRPLTTTRALECLAELFDVARWLHLTLDGGDPNDAAAAFAPPAPTPDAGATMEAVLEHLRLAEARQEANLAALRNELLERLATAPAGGSAATRQVQQQKLELGQRSASILHFDEKTTRRRLIDEELRAAGWDVGAHGKSTQQVGQEVPVTTMRTDSGEGFVDYVLWGDDGKPLALVEAKRVSKDAEVASAQARLYAQCLEQEHGQRPVIFYTNGVDVMLWDDAQGQPKRKVYGFHAKDSLEYLVHQRTFRKPLSQVEPKLAIADRMYQLEAVQQVCDRFGDNHRKALIVQATGTGKTRVAISLCDVLMRAGWVKRILFLCDRRELRKQADGVFKEFMPGEPRVVVSRDTAHDRNKRIYLATYPAMMQCYEDFDVGFFDLVIADESHRSLYDHYRVLFLYFDALQVGLTATPVELTDHDTYEMFGCEPGKPTARFDYDDAIGRQPPYLVHFRVRKCTSLFRREGLRWSALSEEQRQQLERQQADAEDLDLDAKDLDARVFNADTTRGLWRTLMDEGIREATGSHVGKTIVFARSHEHAVHLAKVFEQTYPQYGSAFCQVIDTKVSHAEHLIDDFKDPTHALTIAISVDMLDTGIDVPQVVNLVFAKPVRSKVKFWQMIGRGTRLCPDLFGPGRDKQEFLIFDHGDNFFYFDEKYREPKRGAPPKSLLQRLFEARIELAAVAVERMDDPALELATGLLVADVRAVIDTKSLVVRDRRRELEALADPERVGRFAAPTQADLRSIAGPLQGQRDIRRHEDAHGFDLQMTRLQVEVLRGGPDAPSVHDLRGRVQDAVERLPKNLEEVRARAAAIGRVRSRDFWAGVEVRALEEVRLELRGVMRYQQTGSMDRVAPLYLDVTDTGFTSEAYVPRLDGLHRVEYKRRVQELLREQYADDAVVVRLRAGQRVEDDELQALAQRLREADEHADVERLRSPVGHRHGEDESPRERSRLEVFRGLCGLDVAAVERAFAGFVERHPRLDARQLRLLQLLQNHIAHNGGIEVARVYEPPFTTVHPESIEGVFADPDDVDELFAIIDQYELRADDDGDGGADEASQT
ncbi:DEAD/DEAH box helicase family protein [Paraliomyxa miuraensis]|uniref:DEAD/DEAH box helicase family protein n=1 Tax=Paraliomyxa miuraensis TaxID=376150 RepID=UPI00225124E4|nr:DEAD/DEAH box helicase family protein [Paraliomyxa miuraensis]MCX4246621.1 DEAD/DEAH box helicase family protein [Paraliomyxa miuraensis]